jgi:dTDP-4-dehydrorhamnose 3,5-epimerase
MVSEIIAGVYYQPLNIINTTGGSVMHAIKGFDDNFPEFGECYFSTAESKSPKAWKKHSRMICNLFVPEGNVRFVFYDDRDTSKDKGRIEEFTLGKQNYGRLIIQPGIWFGFSAIAEGADSIILNVSNIGHDPQESIRLEPGASEIPYTWTF